jgi:tRNA(fMet)-specific endonuclease VapC
MKYLLDTNTCIRFINGRAPRIREHFLALDRQDIVVSSITKAELYFGSAKSQTPEQSRAKQEAFLNGLNSIPFDDNAALIYGPLRAMLERSGTPIGQLDSLIAAIAITHSLILVTHNTREFARIPNLRLEDWEI